MLRIAIVEDNPTHAQKLEEYLTRYEAEKNCAFESTHFSNGLDFLEAFSPQWDVIFLDIEMPGIDGMSVAEKIRSLNSAVVLIFVTNLTRYAIRGYSVNAMDYILKPLRYTPFSMTLDKIIHFCESMNDLFICLTLKDEVRRVSLNSIYYVEVDRHYLTYHTDTGDYSVRGTISAAEKELNSYFAKCNSCYLVNLKYVEALNREEVSVGPYRLRISRRMYVPFLEALNRYWGKRGT